VTGPQGPVLPPEALDIGEVELEVRPRRIRWVASILAVFIFAFFAAGALLVYVGTSGFTFRPADQVAMVVLGALLAGGALLFTRPRLRAGAGSRCGPRSSRAACRGRRSSR
jgi:hypothetical protein